MRINVKDLEPNPYRKMEHYPVDRNKVDALKNSIKEKSFWDNLLVRKHGKKYQLAYGHHRWQALKELGIKQIDVPVRDIDDATMLQIMAEENLNWSTSPAIMTQTIQTAKEFLDAELAKYDTLELAGDFASQLFDDQQAFANAKRKDTGGVGRDTLVKFLGGNWTGHKVRIALDIINDKELSQPAIDAIPTMEQATVFRSSVKKHKIPKSAQKKIATKIAQEGVGKRDIPDLVAEHSPLPAKRKPEPKPLPMLDDVIKETCKLMDTLRTNLKRVNGHLDNVQSARLRSAFVRDGKELTKLMKGIFDEM